MEPRWFNLYGPHKEESFFSLLTNSLVNKDTIFEDHIYYGQLLVKAKLLKNEKIKNIYEDILNNNDTKEKINLTNYCFWLDLYQLRLLDKHYLNQCIKIEYQFSTHIGISDNAEYDSNKEKFYWKQNDRRIKRVELKMCSDIVDLPLSFIRLKLNNEYIGYIKFDIKQLINRFEVSPSWMRIRKCETNIKNYEDPKNYIGELFCAFNVFIDNNNDYTKRPALLDNYSYKNFILISRIYMGKNFPKLNEDQENFCEVQFYNNKEKPIKTQQVSETPNPIWMKTLFHRARLNENLEFTQNIKLIAKSNLNKKSDFRIGELEIKINQIDIFRDEKLIEKEKIYKKAKWYAIDNSESKEKCYVLARFILLMLHKQEKETIIKIRDAMENDKPELIRCYFKFFVIGLRNIPKPLEESSIKIKYGCVDLLKSEKNETNMHPLEVIDKNFNKKNYSKEINYFNHNIYYVN